MTRAFRGLAAAVPQDTPSPLLSSRTSGAAARVWRQCQAVPQRADRHAAARSLDVELGDHGWGDRRRIGTALLVVLHDRHRVTERGGGETAGRSTQHSWGDTARKPSPRIRQGSRGAGCSETKARQRACQA